MTFRSPQVVFQLSQCGIEKHKRFSFYDQVHTTGMDIPQTQSAKAVVTLGKDMTFRDYAQGTFRMRGIGKGQTIDLFVIPEVTQLITTHVSAGLGTTPAQLQATWQSIGPLDSQPRVERLLKDVAAWLVVNSMRSEKVQFNLLCEQTATNVWRKQAFNTLVDNRDQIGMHRLPKFHESK